MKLTTIILFLMHSICFAQPSLPKTQVKAMSGGAATKSTFFIKANNLSELPSVSSARSNLGLGTAALNSTGDFQAKDAAITVGPTLGGSSDLTRLGGCTTDYYTSVGNSGTGESIIYSYTTPGDALYINGQKIRFDYTLVLSDVTATAIIKVYFGGTVIANTGTLTVSATGAVVVTGWLIRTGATTVRASVNISSPGASTAVYTSQTDLTSLTLTGTNILKLTGQAGGAGGGSNDITGKMGSVYWFGAGQN